MNLKIAQYILPKLIRGGKGSSQLAYRAATTIFSAPQTAKTSTSIFSKFTNKTCNATKQTAQKAFDRVVASDTFTATKKYARNVGQKAYKGCVIVEKYTNKTCQKIKKSKTFGHVKDRMIKSKNWFTGTKFYTNILVPVGKWSKLFVRKYCIALPCKKSKVIYDTYKEIRTLGKTYSIAKNSVKYNGPFKVLVKNGTGVLEMAKEAGPIPFATGAAGAVMVPCPGTAEIGLFLGLLTKNSATKISNKLISCADNCFLTLVK